MDNEDNYKGRLLNVEELAGVLGVPVSWIYEKCRAGSTTVSMPAMKIGRYVRFHLPSVMEWLENTKGLERKV